MSDVSSPVGETNPQFEGLATCYHGDYDQMAIVNNVAHMVWADDRRITETGPNPDVYYDQLQLNRHSGASAACPKRSRAARALVSGSAMRISQAPAPKRSR